MDLLIKIDTIKDGITNIVPTGGTLLKDLGFSILKLKQGEILKIDKQEVETAAVILKGRCSIELNGISYENIGKRKDIFNENATAVYIPYGEKYSVEAIEEVEIGLCYARTDKKKSPFIVHPEDVKLRKIGKDNYTRIGKDIISEINDVDKLYVGETISFNGCWSSFPPHKHDRDMFPMETQLEEIYHYRISPKRGFGIQKIYTQDRDIDETYTVENYDTVLIPRGYHPVVGCPGYKIYYLWILGGKKRQYKLFEDEDHSWIS